MKFTKPIITAAAAVGISVAMAATASAYSTVGKFGTYERLYDAGGAVVTAWTVDNLNPAPTASPRTRCTARCGRPPPPSSPSGAPSRR